MKTFTFFDNITIHKREEKEKEKEENKRRNSI
jgi:hypothetical protein